MEAPILPLIVSIYKIPAPSYLWSRWYRLVAMLMLNCIDMLCGSVLTTRLRAGAVVTARSWRMPDALPMPRRSVRRPCIANGAPHQHEEERDAGYEVVYGVPALVWTRLIPRGCTAWFVSIGKAKTRSIGSAK
jgi:hypothetical protein